MDANGATRNIFRYKRIRRNTVEKNSKDFR